MRHCFPLSLTCLTLAGFALAPSDTLASDAKEAELEQAAVAAIRRLGGAVRQIALNDAAVEIDFHLSGAELTDAGLVHLAEIKNLVWLHLSNTEISDAGLAHLKGLSRLTRLHLEKTAIGDSGLAHLVGLVNLEYLNLYGTKVSDGGIVHLKKMKNLRKVYLWETHVSDAGTRELSKAMPHLQVDRGDIVIPEPPKPPKKSLAKGRFVKIQLLGDDRVLSLAEVQVIETATGKPLHRAGRASQSSTIFEAAAARAIDGSINSFWDAGSITHTLDERNPWWIVDLGAVKDIGRISVYNRGDGLGARLAGAVVEVLALDLEVVWTGRVEGAGGTSPHHFESQ